MKWEKEEKETEKERLIRMKKKMKEDDEEGVKFTMSYYRACVYCEMRNSEFYQKKEYKGRLPIINDLQQLVDSNRYEKGTMYVFRNDVQIFEHVMVDHFREFLMNFIVLILKEFLPEWENITIQLVY